MTQLVQVLPVETYLGIRKQLVPLVGHSQVIVIILQVHGSKMIVLYSGGKMMRCRRNGQRR